VPFGCKVVDLIVSIFRNLVGVFNYLNHDRVNSRMLTTANDIREQLGLAQVLWNQQNPDSEINLLEYWDEWLRDF
jgi:hypothetical protein